MSDVKKTTSSDHARILGKIKTPKKAKASKKNGQRNRGPKRG